MSSGLRRGEIYRVRQPQHGGPKKSRCFAVVSRQDLLDSKANRVLCAPINTSGVGLSTEVQVGVDEGLKHDSVILGSNILPAQSWQVGCLLRSGLVQDFWLIYGSLGKILSFTQRT